MVLDHEILNSYINTVCDKKEHHAHARLSELLLTVNVTFGPNPARIKLSQAQLTVNKQTLLY